MIISYDAQIMLHAIVNILIYNYNNHTSPNKNSTPKPIICVLILVLTLVLITGRSLAGVLGYSCRCDRY